MPIRTELRDGIQWLEIDRPDKLNALNEQLLVELKAALDHAVADPAVRVILLTGAGERAFAAGADIAEMVDADTAGIRRLMDLGREIALALENAPQPVIAVVNGYALGGGCELALACDLVVASEQAQFGLPELSLGLIPGWGGTQRLERRIGYGRARDMLFTGRRIGAAEALTWGLADRVVPHESLWEEATTLAASLAKQDAVALAAGKRALQARNHASLAEGLKIEAELFDQLSARPERRNLMKRFVKRG